MSNFKSDQLKYPRVKDAYEEKYSTIQSELERNGLRTEKIKIFLRAFKNEKKLQLWAHEDENEFILIKEYDFCATSGKLGPKREQGDLQIPEGLYHIDRFNPSSKFHLSLGINYPNKSDRILGAGNPGGDIFIHGDCVTIGCIPITNDKIKELYVYTVEAKNNGQSKIPVHIYPFKMDQENWEVMSKRFSENKTLIRFWSGLRVFYENFEKTRSLDPYTISESGSYLMR